MSLDLSGRDAPVKQANVTIEISEGHPLILLAKCLPWANLVDLVLQDLKTSTVKGCWWLGRKIQVRTHVSVLLLQKLHNLTDRKMEYSLKDNAAYQVFCGVGIVEGWNPPDHTSIEDFRNRLSTETQRALANELARVSVELGFGDPRETDFDSTVQEANISYPSDASLLLKLANMGKKVVKFMEERVKGILPENLQIDIRAIRERAREYFFLAKNTNIEKRREVFRGLHKFVKKQLYPLIDICGSLSDGQIGELPWNIRQSVERIASDGKRYLLDVAHFIRSHSIKPGKLLSWHAKDVACVKKGKVGKEMEFGRVFQLGRIKGNFMFVLGCTDLKMNDKKCFSSLVEEHRKIFGEGEINSISADKGYWSAKNRESLKKAGIPTEGLQRPANIKEEQSWNPDVAEVLRNRRAGIEPLIGHAKTGGQLGKSRMKSDTATLAAGYGSVLGFNLRQLIRHQKGIMERVA